MLHPIAYLTCLVFSWFTFLFCIERTMYSMCMRMPGYASLWLFLALCSGANTLQILKIVSIIIK